MTPLTRKQFLLSLGAGASAIAISSCDQKKTTSLRPTATRISEQKQDSPNTPGPADNVISPTQTNTGQAPVAESTSSQPKQLETPTDKVLSPPIPTDTIRPIAISPTGSPDLVVA